MTHTIADAEAAIARHPEDLEQLSKAADLLIGAGDPRGEDFAACLDGRLGVEDLMRKWPADVSAMFVAAWNMGQSIDPRTGRLRAEALRLLAECGKVGEDGKRGYGYPYWSIPEMPPAVRVPQEWWYRTSLALGGDGILGLDLISCRLALLDAYAAADPDARRRWAAETRAMTPAGVVNG